MPFFLSFLRNPKLLMAGAAIIVLLMGGWYVFSTVEENGQLKAELNQTSTELANTKLTLKNEKERFSQTISNYDEVMSKYLTDVSTSSEQNRRLRNTISRLSKSNKELQQCMDMKLPGVLIDEIFTGGRK